MKEEKLNSGEISIKGNKFLAWLDNFWYHYKWHTIVTAFILIVIGVCIFQACTTEKNDIIFTYAGPKNFVGESAEKMDVNSALSNASKPVYGDDANAGLKSYLIYSKSQIEDIESENYVSESERPRVDTAKNTANMNSLKEYLKCGDSYILLLDPSIYNNEIDKSSLVKLSDVYGTTPDGASDEYSVRLGNTKIYNDVPEMQVLPSDTVVCLYSKLLITRQDDYNNNLEVFKSFAILNEATPEETGK